MIDAKFRVIQLRAADAGRAKALLRAIEAESVPHEPEAPDRAERGFARSLSAFDFLSSHSFWFLAAEVGDALVGYMTLVRIPKADARLGTLYVDELYVLRTFRRQGIGRAIMSEALRIARGLGYWRLRLNADPRDPAVRAFYEACGLRDNDDGFFQRDV